VRRKLRFAPATVTEDLAQEVMVTLFRLSQRETLINPDALITTLTHRICVDHVRRMRGPTGRLDPLPESDHRWTRPESAPGGAAWLRRNHSAARRSRHDMAAQFFAEQSSSNVARQRGSNPTR
jgi:DNA-directed RNA polymerase specialized sigma24 family protein